MITNAMEQQQQQLDTGNGNDNNNENNNNTTFDFDQQQQQHPGNGSNANYNVSFSSPMFVIQENNLPSITPPPPQSNSANGFHHPQHHHIQVGFQQQQPHQHQHHNNIPQQIHHGHHHPHIGQNHVNGGGSGKSPFGKINARAEIDPVKLEKKRERNRIAATKCRQRKLEKISTLEKQVEQLKSEKAEMARQSDRLRKDLEELKAHIHFHYEQGCTLDGPQQQQQQHQHILQQHLPLHPQHQEEVAEEDSKIDLQKQLQALEQLS